MSQSDAKHLASLKARYAQATKKQRSKILDEYVATTGCHRKHVIAVLRGKYKRVKGPIRRRYTDEDGRAVRALAELFDDICSKWLLVAMNTELPRLREGGALQVSPECYERLKQISPATMDRLRARYGRIGGKTRG